MRHSRNRKKVHFKRRDIYRLFRMFGASGASWRGLVSALFIGASFGVAYEEMFGIGTWHSFNAETSRINVCFTPPSGCGSLIAGEIVAAKRSIFVQAYGLTSNAIIYQLKAAVERGVIVAVLLDGGNLSDNKDIYTELKEAGIKVAYDKMSGIAHNKVMIIDKSKVITGSFNFTRAADTKNAENVLLIKDQDIAKLYLNNWLSRARLSGLI